MNGHEETILSTTFDLKSKNIITYSNIDNEFKTKSQKELTKTIIKLNYVIP